MDSAEDKERETTSTPEIIDNTCSEISEITNSDEPFDEPFDAPFVASPGITPDESVDDSVEESVEESLAIPVSPSTITMNHPDILAFWDTIHENFELISNSIFEGHGMRVLKYLQEKVLSKDLAKFIEIELTFGQINKQQLDASSNLIELYITPRFKADNIPIMQAMYDCYYSGLTGPCIKSLHVIKYKPYHPKDQIIAEIDFKAFKVTYDSLGFHGSFGFSEEKKPQMNIVIIVKQPLAAKILQKKTVYFNNHGRQSSREVWMCESSNAVDLFLINILGEYNLLHHVGYIELLPSDDPLVEKTSVFTELSDMRSSMALIDKQYKYSACNYCSRHELATSLKKCNRCRLTRYCSKLCQLCDWKNHKMGCVVHS